MAKEAARLLGKVIVICSVNPVKKDKVFFTPDECKKMWKTYDLGQNIDVVTLEEFLAGWNRAIPLVIVRGIRNNNDIIYENNVILHNCKEFGVRHYHYVLCEDQFKKMSSSAVRTATLGNDAATLGQMVNPEIAGRLLERASHILNQ